MTPNGVESLTPHPRCGRDYAAFLNCSNRSASRSSIGPVFIPLPRRLDHLPGDPFQPEFEKRAIMDSEQPIRDMDSVIGVDPDQMNIEGRMVDLGQRQAVRDDRLPKLLVRIHDDVSGIEQPRLGQMGDRAAASVGAQDGISERCLVQTSL